MVVWYARFLYGYQINPDTPLNRFPFRLNVRFATRPGSSNATGTAGLW
jgi:hypothetical protein